MGTGGAARAFGVVFSARIAAAGAAFVATILIARFLGPDRFGPFAVLLAAVNVAAGLISPALDTGMVRFAAQTRAASVAITGYFFRLKALVALLTVAAGVVLAVPLHRLFLAEAEGIGPSAFVIAFACAGVMVLWASVQAWCQAEQRFTRWAFQEAATGFIRLAWVIPVLLIGGLGERSLLAGYGIAAGAIAVIGALAMPREVWRAPKPDPEMRRDIFLFTQWVVLACFATSLSQRLDVFLLAGYGAPPATLGHYNAALNLALVGELAIMTLFHVLLPKASALTDPTEWLIFLKRHQRRAVAAGILLLPLAGAGGWVVALVFGQDYAEAGPYFGALLIGTAFVLSSAPAGAVLYSAGHSRVVAILELVKLACILLAGLAAVPFYGPMGMAITVAAVRGLVAIATYIVARVVIARAIRAQAGTSA